MRLIDAYRDTWGGRPIDPKEMRAAVERELTAALTAQPSEPEFVRLREQLSNAAFERGRLQGMEQERALWKLSAEAQAEGAYAPAEPVQAQADYVSVPSLTPPQPETTLTTTAAWGWNGDTCAVWGDAIVLGQTKAEKEDKARRIAASLATPQAAASVERVPLSYAEISAGWHATFSTSNPFCPCDLKTFTKVVRWTEAVYRRAGAPATTTGEQT
jgi:hypothetical protein